MKKAPLGLILFLYISLFSGSTQSLPQRSARMDSEWKEEKRGKVVGDAIIVEHENEHSSGSGNGGPKKLILPFNRMAIRKRNVVSVDENGQAFPGTAETGGDNADLFRPLNEKRLIGGPPVRPPYGKRQIVARPDYYPGALADLTTIKLNPGHAVLQKRQIVSVDNDGQTFEGTAETETSDLFRPLPQKRQIVSVDNDGQTFEGTAETETSDLFRPLPQKRQIVSVDNDGQTSQGTPETGNSDNSHLFRPLKEKRYNSMMELTRLPAHKKRSGN